RQPVRFSSHVRRSAAAPKDLRQTARCEDDAARRDGDERAGREVQGYSTARAALRDADLNRGDVAQPPDVLHPGDGPAERGGDGRTGAQKIDVTTPFAAMPRRADLFDVPVFARPPGPPALHFENAVRAEPAQRLGQLRIADGASGLERVLQVKRPVVRFFLADRGRDGHLRHDSRATTAYEVLVEQEDGTTFSRCRDGRIHPGSAGAYDEHVAGEVAHGAGWPSGPL